MALMFVVGGTVREPSRQDTKDLRHQINSKINKCAAGDMGGQWMTSTVDEYEHQRHEKDAIEQLEERNKNAEFEVEAGIEASNHRTENAGVFSSALN
jgi:hypothetical protein